MNTQGIWISVREVCIEVGLKSSGLAAILPSPYIVLSIDLQLKIQENLPGEPRRGSNAFSIKFQLEMNRKHVRGITFLIKCQWKCKGNNQEECRDRSAAFWITFLSPWSKPEWDQLHSQFCFNLKWKDISLGELRAASGAYSIFGFLYERCAVKLFCNHLVRKPYFRHPTWHESMIRVANTIRSQT